MYGQPMQKQHHKLNQAADIVEKSDNQLSKRAILESGDIIFNETFDSTLWHTAQADGVAIPANMPNGWTTYDFTGNSFVWRWSITGPRGVYTSGYGPGPNAHLPNNNQRVKSTSDNSTAERGFMMLESDYYNTTSAGTEATVLIVMDTYLQTRAIETTDNPAVSIYFEQWHRFCCSSYSANVGPKLFVSNDGTNWTRYDVHQAGINQTPRVNPSIVEMSISTVAASQSTVYIRFHHIGQDAYHWSIDDVTLYEPAPYDTRVLDYWADYAEERFSYYTHTYYAKLYSGTPYFSPYHSFQQFVTSRALAQNYGANASTNLTMTTKFFQGETELHSGTSAPVANHSIGARDSLEIIHNYQIPRLESSVGAYHVSGLLVTAEEDEMPLNNIYTYDFNITKNLFGYVDPRYASTDRQSPFSYVGSVDGDGCGVIFMLNPTSGSLPYTLEGLNIFIPSDGYNWDIWEMGEFGYLTAEIYEGTRNGAEYDFDMTVPLASSESTPIDSMMVNTWVYLPFIKDGAGENISPTNQGHQYFAVIRFYSNNTRFFIGADKFTQPSFYANWLVTGNEPGWVSATTSISMELIMNKFGENPTSNVQFYAHNNNSNSPASGAIITLFTQNTVTEAIEINHTVGSNGIVTVANLRSGTYAYKATHEDEVKTGSFTVYGTDQNIRIDFGIVGITNNHVASELKIYPNPTQGTVTIESQGLIAKVVISNILGQTVEVINAPSELETISVANYPTGVYMVTAFDKQGNKTTQRLIKQ
jgi:hypothetical protein